MLIISTSFFEVLFILTMAGKVAAVWLLPVWLSQVQQHQQQQSQSQSVQLVYLFPQSVGFRLSELVVQVQGGGMRIGIGSGSETPSNKSLPWRQKANLCALCAVLFEFAIFFIGSTIYSRIWLLCYSQNLFQERVWVMFII